MKNAKTLIILILIVLLIVVVFTDKKSNTYVSPLIPNIGDVVAVALEAGRIINVPCPATIDIGTSESYAPGVKPTNEEATRALSNAYLNFICEDDCAKIITLTSKVNTGLWAGNTGLIVWDFKGTLECKENP